MLRLSSLSPYFHILGDLTDILNSYRHIVFLFSLIRRATIADIVIVDDDATFYRVKKCFWKRNYSYMFLIFLVLISASLAACQLFSKFKPGNHKKSVIYCLIF